MSSPSVIPQAQAVGLRCPSCGQKGKAVQPVTLRALLKPEAQARLGEGPYRFCASPECETVYYAADGGPGFAKSDLTVRVGVKETEAPRPICYCFEHSIEEIEDEVKRTGKSSVLADIKARMKDGCWCETKSPQGGCCLSTVSRYEKLALARHGQAVPADPGAEVEAEEAHEDCCAREAAPEDPPGAPSRKTGLWAAGGALFAALLSSACCWLPLVLILFGASAAGVAGFFEAYRPYFLGLTALLLGAGFYMAYFRKERCAPGSACAAPSRKLVRFNKIMLWMASVAVLLFAFFPNYVGFLLGGGSGGGNKGSAAAPAVLANGSRSVRLKITGMTCVSCAISLQARLAKVPGVQSASVNYEAGRASVVLAPHGKTQALLDAIAEQGFVGKREGSLAGTTGKTGTRAGEGSGGKCGAGCSGSSCPLFLRPKPKP